MIKVGDGPVMVDLTVEDLKILSIGGHHSGAVATEDAAVDGVLHLAVFYTDVMCSLVYADAELGSPRVDNQPVENHILYIGIGQVQDLAANTRAKNHGVARVCRNDRSIRPTCAGRNPCSITIDPLDI